LGNAGGEFCRAKDGGRVRTSQFALMVLVHGEGRKNLRTGRPGVRDARVPQEKWARGMWNCTEKGRKKKVRDSLLFDLCSQI